MPELERMLTELGRELDWPPTPDLEERMAARIARPAPRRRPLRGLRRSLAVALAVLLLLAAAAVAAVPGVRDAVLELFGLQGATVQRTGSLPAPPPQRPLEPGRRTTLEAARGRIGFEPLLPADPGEPDRVYVRAGVPGGELSLAYRAEAGLPRAGTGLGLLLSEFRGDLAPEYVGKIAGSGAAVERLRVDGKRALWIGGAPHFFFYRDPDGATRERELRLAQNVLLLERGRLLVRLEGAFSRDRALAIARSLR
jgi:hypothetical protein